MYKKTLIISLGFLLLLISGCSSSKRVVIAEKKELPSWYTNPPKSSHSELYAIGNGRDRQSAITDALTHMVSTLSVSVSSKFSAKTVVREGSINSSNGIYTDESSSEVKEIRISNYELLNSQSLGFKNYAVLVKSNKQKLFLSMKKEIEQNFEIFQQQERSIKSLNMIKQLSFYKNSKETFSYLPNTLTVMKELDRNFDGSEYLIKAQVINTKYEELLGSITISIESNLDGKNLIAPIAKGISAKKLNLVDGSGEKHFNIHIKSDIKKASSYGFTLARSSIVIIIKDAKGNIIGSNKLNITGQSNGRYDIAKENVAVKLNALIEKEGISKVIGLTL